MPSALVCVVEGFEPIECITMVDVLRRGGVSVTLAGTEKVQKGAHGITVHTDALVSEVGSTLYDAIMLPGGPGWKEMQTNGAIRALTENHSKHGKWVMAICAAPSASLASWGLLKDKRATCYPAMKDVLVANGAQFIDEPVVVDGKFLTSQGPATALPFAVKALELLVTSEKYNEVTKGMLLHLVHK